MALGAAIKQYTFAGGEISQELTARTDLERYAQSLGTMENWIVTPTGVAKNRPGWKYAGEIADSTKRGRLIPFVFNQDQQYAIELGDHTIRFSQDGGPLQTKTTRRGAADATHATILTFKRFLINCLVPLGP